MTKLERLQAEVVDTLEGKTSLIATCFSVIHSDGFANIASKKMWEDDAPCSADKDMAYGYHLLMHHEKFGYIRDAYHKGDFAKIQEVCDQLLLDGKINCDIAYWKGWAYERQKDYVRAEIFYRISLWMGIPYHAEAYNALCTMYETDGGEFVADALEKIDAFVAKCKQERK